jgi:ketosteroid isomerase-like protein
MNTVQLARDVYDAFGKGDIPAVLDFFAPDMEWHPAEGHPFRPDGSPWIGRQAIAEGFFAQIGAAWTSFTVTPRAFHDAGDTVVVEGRYTGVLRESGQTIDAQFCHIWTTRHGRMRSFQQYMDTAQLQRAATAVAR